MAPPYDSVEDEDFESKAEFFEYNTGPAHAIPIWKVARATSAAPSFLDPMEIDGEKFIDGGFGCNNPAAVAYFEVTQMHNHNPNFVRLLLSVGTGESDFSCGAGSGWTNVLNVLKALPKNITNGKDGHNTMLNMKKLHKLHYCRWNVGKELGNLRMNEWLIIGSEKRTEMRIRSLTEDYLKQEAVVAQMQKVAKALVQHRRERARTTTWDRVATGARFRCPFDQCTSGHRYRETEEDLVAHFKRRHCDETDAAKQKALRVGKIPAV